VKDLVVPFLREDVKAKLMTTAAGGEKEDEPQEGTVKSANYINPSIPSRQLSLTSEAKMGALKKAMKYMYQKTDEELLRRCGIEGKHYAASTSVTLCLWQDLICVGHLGDSRICLIYITEQNLKSFEGVTAFKDAVHGSTGARAVVTSASAAGALANKNEDVASKENDENAKPAEDIESNKKELKENSIGVDSYVPKTLDADWIAPGAVRTDSIPVAKVDEIIEGNFVTNDHKPDQGEERQRIEASGGSVEYLHNHQNKPFIRGGDFQQRKLLGESPMQLQYSRAFGGKDLKPFGLIADPTVNVTKREKQFVGFILASDGLWDVLSADVAARTATKAFLNKSNPSEALVNKAVHQSCDNITAICVFYDSVGGER